MSVIHMDACPFREGNRVHDIYSGEDGVVDRVSDQTVWVITDSGKYFYRTWTHDYDAVFRKGGGGLVRIGERE